VFPVGAFVGLFRERLALLETTMSDHLPPLSVGMLDALPKDQVVVAYNDRWLVQYPSDDMDLGYLEVVRPQLPKE
jgi:hypothetical protein